MFFKREAPSCFPRRSTSMTSSVSTTLPPFARTNATARSNHPLTPHVSSEEVTLQYRNNSPWSSMTTKLNNSTHYSVSFPYDSSTHRFTIFLIVICSLLALLLPLVMVVLKKFFNKGSSNIKHRKLKSFPRDLLLASTGFDEAGKSETAGNKVAQTPFIEQKEERTGRNSFAKRTKDSGDGSLQISLENVKGIGCPSRLDRDWSNDSSIENFGNTRNFPSKEDRDPESLKQWFHGRETEQGISSDMELKGSSTSDWSLGQGKDPKTGTGDFRNTTLSRDEAVRSRKVKERTGYRCSLKRNRGSARRLIRKVMRPRKIKAKSMRPTGHRPFLKKSRGSDRRLVRETMRSRKIKVRSMIPTGHQLSPKKEKGMRRRLICKIRTPRKIKARVPPTDLRLSLKEGRGLDRRSNKDKVSWKDRHRGRSKDCSTKKRRLHQDLDVVNKFNRKGWYWLETNKRVVLRKLLATIFTFQRQQKPRLNTDNWIVHLKDIFYWPYDRGKFNYNCI